MPEAGGASGPPPTLRLPPKQDLALHVAHPCHQHLVGCLGLCPVALETRTGMMRHCRSGISQTRELRVPEAECGNLIWWLHAI